MFSSISHKKHGALFMPNIICYLLYVVEWLLLETKKLINTRGRPRWQLVRLLLKTNCMPSIRFSFRLLSKFFGMIATNIYNWLFTFLQSISEQVAAYMRDPSKMVKGMQQNRSAVAVFGTVGFNLISTSIWLLNKHFDQLVAVRVYILTCFAFQQVPVSTENIKQEVLIYWCLLIMHIVVFPWLHIHQLLLSA